MAQEYSLTGFKAENHTSYDWEQNVAQTFGLSFPVTVTTDEYGVFYQKSIYGIPHSFHIDIFDVEPIV
jgi:hypothetical protein